MRIVISLGAALGFVAMLVAAMSIMGEPWAFLDLPSVALTVIGTGLLLVATHGLWETVSSLGGGLLGALGLLDRQSAEHHAMGAHVAQSGSFLSITVAALGMLIGVVHMLRSLDDPATVGPAVAVALLTPYYAGLLNALLFVPAARYHRAQLIDPPPSTPTPQARPAVGGLATAK